MYLELKLTVVVVLLVGAVLLHVDVATGPEPSGLAHALPLHHHVGLALPVAVAVVRAALQGTVLAVPT